jgi:hypothetical protein
MAVQEPDDRPIRRVVTRQASPRGVEDCRVSYGWSSVCLGVGDWAVLSLASGSLPDS